MSSLSAPFFHDEAAAFEDLESSLWSNGPVCPHCGGMVRVARVKGGRMGLRRCGDPKQILRSSAAAQADPGDNPA